MRLLGTCKDVSCFSRSIYLSHYLGHSRTCLKGLQNLYVVLSLEYMEGYKLLVSVENPQQIWISDACQGSQRKGAETFPHLWKLINENPLRRIRENTESWNERKRIRVSNHIPLCCRSYIFPPFSYLLVLSSAGFIPKISKSFLGFSGWRLRKLSLFLCR